MERSGFFDANVTDGEYDRAYGASDFADYFASFIGNGVFGGKFNVLQVIESNPRAMSIVVRTGQGWINGYWYENDTDCVKTIETADGILNRIDIVVLRKGITERDIKLEVRTGTPASNPIPPTVLRNDDYYELKLAEIYISAGASSIGQGNITDYRFDSNVCGLVKGLIEQINTSQYANQLVSFIGDFKATSIQEAADLLAELNTLVASDTVGQLVARLDKLERITEVTFLSENWDTTSLPYTQTINDVARASASLDAIMVSALHQGATLESQKSYLKAFAIMSTGVLSMGDGTITANVYKLPATDITVGIKGI